MPKEYRDFNGKRYTYRASFPKKVAEEVVKELRQRKGVSARMTRETKKGLGVYWYSVWVRVST